MTNVTSATAKRSDTISVTYELSISVDELVSELVHFDDQVYSLTINDLISHAKKWAQEECGIRPSCLEWKYEGESLYVFSDSISSDPTSVANNEDFLFTRGVIEE